MTFPIRKSARKLTGIVKNTIPEVFPEMKLLGNVIIFPVTADSALGLEDKTEAVISMNAPVSVAGDDAPARLQLNCVNMEQRTPILSSFPVRLTTFLEYCCDFLVFSI